MRGGVLETRARAGQDRRCFVESGPRLYQIWPNSDQAAPNSRLQPNLWLISANFLARVRPIWGNVEFRTNLVNIGQVWRGVDHGRVASAEVGFWARGGRPCPSRDPEPRRLHDSPPLRERLLAAGASEWDGSSAGRVCQTPTSPQTPFHREPRNHTEQASWGIAGEHHTHSTCQANSFGPPNTCKARRVSGASQGLPRSSECVRGRPMPCNQGLPRTMLSNALQGLPNKALYGLPMRSTDFRWLPRSSNVNGSKDVQGLPSVSEDFQARPKDFKGLRRPPKGFRPLRPSKTGCQGLPRPPKTFPRAWNASACRPMVLEGLACAEKEAWGAFQTMVGGFQVPSIVLGVRVTTKHMYELRKPKNWMLAFVCWASWGMAISAKLAMCSKLGQSWHNLGGALRHSRANLVQLGSVSAKFRPTMVRTRPLAGRFANRSLRGPVCIQIRARRGPKSQLHGPSGRGFR